MAKGAIMKGNPDFKGKSILLIAILLMVLSPLFPQVFGQNKVNAVDSNWSMISSMHFDVYFPAGYDDFGKLVTLMAEETYYNLKEDLRFPLTSRVPLIVYGTKSEFQVTNVIYPLLTEGVGGFTESLRNRVVIPFEGSYAKLEELMAHELTHAYTNAINRDGRFFTTMRSSSFPFWFSEGLPEFLSIGGEDDYNNMFIMDMVVNDRLPSLEYSEGYLAYRLGESFLSYIAEVWGREKVSEYYYALRSGRNTDESTKKVFGMDMEELESRWRYHLKRLYYPAVGSHGAPREEMEQRTFSHKDGSYFNYMPRFSPDGSSYVYFSNQGARYSVWLSGTHGLYPPRKVITGERSGDMEEFYYFRSNLSWFPDSRRVAFSSKTATGDVIHILDTQKEKIVSTIRIPELRAIYEIDVSADGERIVLSGQTGVQSDIFIYHLKTKELERLTDDLYWDIQPRWAPDGKSVVFSSERILDPKGTRRGMFANYRSAIFKLDLDSGKLWQMSDEEGNCSFPMYANAGDELLYLTSEEGVSNYRILNLKTNQKAKVTKVLAGIYAGDVSKDTRYMVVSDYFGGAWDIYFAYNPLDSLHYEPAAAPQLYQNRKDMWDEMDLKRLDIYGKMPKSKIKRINPAPQYDARRPILGPIPEFEYTQEDSLLFFQDYGYDNRPTQPGDTIPEVGKYKSGFAVEHLYGGAAYSSSVGAVGFVELGLADIMGNHGIGVSLGISGKLKENNIMLSYLYLKKRSDFGLGLFNFFDERVYRDASPNPFYFRYKERQTGAYFLWRYPLSRFLRVELDQMLYKRKTGWDLWVSNPGAGSGTWVELEKPEYDWVVAPGVSLVRDTALFGSTGPLVGNRTYVNLRSSISDGKLDYLTLYSDWRYYKLINKRYGFAMRLLGGVSDDFKRDPQVDNAQFFDLWGFNGVRGFEEDIWGHKKMLSSFEFRFPFLDYIAMAFPIPVTIPNIRGAVFADLGTVFNDFSDFKPIQKSKLHDLKLGYGFGPRINLGYVVLRLDIAWASDLSKVSQPSYYLSLSEDF